MTKYTPLGYSDFKTIIKENRYYVDKTTLISSVLKGGQISLLCRPRRFGKSLNLSMLRYFFDKSIDNSKLFEGLKVHQESETIKHQGKYPVIMLSFKDIRADTFRNGYYDLCNLLYSEWNRHNYLIDNNLYVEQLHLLKLSLENGTPNSDLYIGSIRQLCNFLSKHFDAPVVILIDEYDTPLQNAWLNGYFEEMVSFMRKLLGSALKDNPNLKNAVITGILRVAKESLFSDLNNFTASSGILIDSFADKFGFTEEEVVTMFHHYGLNGREMEEIRNWYNGYRFGNKIIYNPWSLLNFVHSEHKMMLPYWVNTSGNELLKRLFFAKSANIRPFLEPLISGDSITIELTDHLVFKDLELQENAIFNLLLFSGYLRAENPQSIGEIVQYNLSIPNREIRKAFVDTVSSWLRSDIQDDIKEAMLKALINGDILTFEEFLSDFVLRVFSFYDAKKNQPENFYHAFLLGLLVRLDLHYRIRSNIESGFGRYDICLIPKDITQKGIIMEIKSPNLRRKETLKWALSEAENQIFQQKYDTELVSLGITNILRLAIAVNGKTVKVKEAKLTHN
jgi:hypothetical protein